MSVVQDSNGSNSTPSIYERIRGEVCGPTDIAHSRGYHTRGYDLQHIKQSNKRVNNILSRATNA